MRPERLFILLTEERRERKRQQAMHGMNHRPGQSVRHAPPQGAETAIGNTVVVDAAFASLEQTSSVVGST